jgi:hypothetical protein
MVQATGLCPICRKNPTAEVYKPFCSKRCADLDLQRWLTGGYVLPGGPDDVPRDNDEEG